MWGVRQHFDGSQDPLAHDHCGYSSLSGRFFLSFIALFLMPGLDTNKSFETFDLRPAMTAGLDPFSFHA
jgi:hypothetical protein